MPADPVPVTRAPGPPAVKVVPLDLVVDAVATAALRNGAGVLRAARTDPGPVPDETVGAPAAVTGAHP